MISLAHFKQSTYRLKALKLIATIGKNVSVYSHLCLKKGISQNSII